jgi:hypothetical protein
MPIPTNITKEHILNAISRIKKEGVPKYRNYRTWAMKHDSILLPNKLVISWANVYANGNELSSNVFIAHEANNYLKELGFIVIKVSNNEVW